MTCTSTTGQQSSTICQHKRQHQKFGIIAFASIILVFSILALTGCKSSNNSKSTGCSDPTAVISAFTDALVEGNGDALVNLFYPKLVSFINENNDESLNEYVQQIFDRGFDSFTKEYGPGWNLTFSVQDYRTPTKNEIEELESTYASFANSELEIKIEEARIYEVEQVIKGRIYESSSTHELYVIKVNNRWYLDFFNTSL